MAFYREFTCVICGEMGVDRGYRQDARFCSRTCRNYYFNNRKLPQCKHNAAIICEEQTSENCENCGWNPEVRKVRIDQIKQKRVGSVYG